MNQIRKQYKYKLKFPLNEHDFAVGTNSETDNPAHAFEDTISIAMKDIRSFVLDGADPELGGNLKINDIKYTGAETSPAVILNLLNPVKTITRYEVLIVNVNGFKYLLKPQDIVVGILQTPLTDADFILISKEKEVFCVNLGGGVSIYQEGEDVETESSKTFHFRDIDSDNLEVSLSDDGTKIIINSPVSSSNLAFYIDVNSLASEENGGEAKPFKTLNKALDSFIGTGTWYNPQHKGYKIIMLSHCSLLETAGVDYTGRTNLDINNLIIESNGFYLGLYANPSPDYYPISTRRMTSNMPKTAGLMDYEVNMDFKDVVFQRTGTNAIVDNLNYSFPATTYLSAFAPQQNSVVCYFKKCTFTNDSPIDVGSPDWSTVPNPEDAGNPVLLFGNTVYASNTAPIGAPMIMSEGRAWNKEGVSFRLEGCFLNNSTGTCLKLKNTSFTQFEDTFTNMNRNNLRRFYGTLVDGYYSPRTGLFGLELEDTNYCSIKGGYISTMPEVLSTEVSPRKRQIGGSEALFKLTNSSLYINKGSSTQEQFENMIKLDGNSSITLNGFTDYFSCSEDVHGVVKVVAPLPVSSKFLEFSNTVIDQVKVDSTGVDKSYIQRIVGFNNTINNAPHNGDDNSYVDDATAIASGLIQGSIYFNTTVGALKKII